MNKIFNNPLKLHIGFLSYSVFNFKFAGFEYSNINNVPSFIDIVATNSFFYSMTVTAQTINNY